MYRAQEKGGASGAAAATAVVVVVLEDGDSISKYRRDDGEGVVMLTTLGLGTGLLLLASMTSGLYGEKADGYNDCGKGLAEGDP